MKALSSIGLKEVQAVYGGPEGDLWELIMGEQIHIGGFQSSMDLAEKAGIGSGMHGVDLCCCNGAGVRFLLRFRNVERMHGVDATLHVLPRARAPDVPSKGTTTGLTSSSPTPARPPALRQVRLRLG